VKRLESALSLRELADELMACSLRLWAPSLHGGVRDRWRPLTDAHRLGLATRQPFALLSRRVADSWTFTLRDPRRGIDPHDLKELSERAGRQLPRVGGATTARVFVTISAWSRTSRAASCALDGIMTSRGPAASMSGTSNPGERRSIDGMAASSSSACTNSASAWFVARAMRARSFMAARRAAR
jgi:hypothetical protein